MVITWGRLKIVQKLHTRHINALKQMSSGIYDPPAKFSNGIGKKTLDELVDMTLAEYGYDKTYGEWGYKITEKGACSI